MTKDKSLQQPLIQEPVVQKECPLLPSLGKDEDEFDNMIQIATQNSLKDQKHGCTICFVVPCNCFQDNDPVSIYVL